MLPHRPTQSAPTAPTAPNDFFVEVSGDFKTEGGPWTVPLGLRTLALGTNGIGKSAVGNALSLCASGEINDIHGRDGESNAAWIGTLSDEGQVHAEATTAGGSHATYTLEGKTGAQAGVSARFPVREVLSMLSAGDAAKRERLLSWAAEGLTDEAVVLKIAARLQPAVRELLAAVRKEPGGAKLSTVDALGQVQALAAKKALAFGSEAAAAQALADQFSTASTAHVDVSALETALDAAAIGVAAAQAAVDEAVEGHAAWTAEVERLQAIQAEWAQAAADAHAQALALHEAEVDRIRALNAKVQEEYMALLEQSSGSSDIATLHASAVALADACLEGAIEGIEQHTCVLCGSPDAKSYLLDYQKFNQKRAARKAAAPVRPTPLPLPSYTAPEPSAKLLAAKEATAEAIVQKDGWSTALSQRQADLSQAVGVKSQAEIALARAQGAQEGASASRAEDLERALAAEAAATASQKRMGDVKTECATLVKILLPNALTTWCAKVNQYMRNGWVFGVEIKGARPLVGLVGPSGNVRVALSGAQWATMVVAIAMAISEGDMAAGRICVIEIPDRDFAPDVRAEVMDAFSAWPGQVLMTSTTAPSHLPEGWSVLDLRRGLENATLLDRLPSDGGGDDGGGDDGGGDPPKAVVNTTPISTPAPAPAPRPALPPVKGHSYENGVQGLALVYLNQRLANAKSLPSDVISTKDIAEHMVSRRLVPSDLDTCLAWLNVTLRRMEAEGEVVCSPAVGIAETVYVEGQSEDPVSDQAEDTASDQAEDMASDLPVDLDAEVLTLVQSPFEGRRARSAGWAELVAAHGEAVLDHGAKHFGVEFPAGLSEAKRRMFLSATEEEQRDAAAKKPKTSQAIKLPAAPIPDPSQITEKTRQELIALGWSSEEVDQMTPGSASRSAVYRLTPKTHMIHESGSVVSRS